MDGQDGQDWLVPLYPVHLVYPCSFLPSQGRADSAGFILALVQVQTRRVAVPPALEVVGTALFSVAANVAQR